jgi:hypothetical protein
MLQPEVDVDREGDNVLPDIRLLLVEFVTHERWVYDSRCFPFVKGAAERLGGVARWLCFGTRIVTAKTGAADVAQYADVPPEDLVQLERHVGELRPTHILTSHPIPAAAGDILRRASEDVRLLSTSDHPGSAGVVSVWDYLEENAAEGRGAAGASSGRPDRGNHRSWLQGRTDWVRRWLGGDPAGVIPADRYLVGAVRPSYDAVMANELALRHRPHLLILGGITCDHLEKLAENEHYAGLDLSACSHDRGCAYCTWFRGASSELGEDPVAIAEEQLRRVQETCRPGGRCCGVYDLLDIRLFARLERFVDAVIRLGLPPATFCFEPRVDRVLRVADQLDRALARCATAGHSIYLFRMGAENLVEEENDLYNKHLSLAQLDEGTARLRALKAAHPDSFEYDPTWGYITCSPWTTLEMLETGIARAIERRLEPLGVWLYTPLLLFPHAPITRLAQREGLVLDEFEDLSLLYEPSVNNVSLSALVPWRFRDPRTGLALGLIVRYCAAALRGKYPDSIFDGDELYARLLARQADLGPFSRPDLFALAVIDLVRAATPPVDRAVLLDRALARCREATAAAAPAGAAADGTAPSPPAAPDLASPPAASAPAFDRARRLRRVLEVVLGRLGPDLGDVVIVEVEPAAGDDDYALEVHVAGEPYRLYLGAPAPTRPSFFRTPHFRVSYARETPLRKPEHVRAVHRLVAALDAATCRHAPDLLGRTAAAAPRPTLPPHRRPR